MGSYIVPILIEEGAFLKMVFLLNTGVLIKNPGFSINTTHTGQIFERFINVAMRARFAKNTSVGLKTHAWDCLCCNLYRRCYFLEIPIA